MGLTASRQPRDRPAFVWGRPAGGERPSRTVEPEARHPAAATLPTRGPHSPRAPRRCRPWSKKEAAWEEEDGGGQERRQRWGCFPERYARVSLRRENREGDSRHRGPPLSPGAVILSGVLRVGLGPRGGGPDGRWRAGNALRARRLRSARAKARAGRREAARWQRGEPRPRAALRRGTPEARTCSHLHKFDGRLVGEERTAVRAFFAFVESFRP